MSRIIITTAATILTLSAAALHPAHAFITGNGLTLNGITQNGLTMNGITGNGLVQNGLVQNGLAGGNVGNAARVVAVELPARSTAAN